MARQQIMLLSDAEAKELAELCPAHKIIINGNEMIGLLQAACTLAYQPAVFALMNEEGEEAHKVGVALGMAIHDSQHVIGGHLKRLAILAAKYQEE